MCSLERGTIGRLFGSVLAFLMLASCATVQLPLSPVSPTGTWKEGPTSDQISERLQQLLEERGVNPNLRLNGELFIVAVPPDGNGADRVESLLRMTSEDNTNVARVTRLNQLVYDLKDYKVLKLSVSYWRARPNTDLGGNSGVFLMSPAQARAARDGRLALDFVRAEPALFWDELRSPESAGAVLTERGVTSKKERIAGRYLIKTGGRVNEVAALNEEVAADFQVAVPVDLLRQVSNDGAAIYMDATLSHEFREDANRPSRLVALRGTFAIFNEDAQGQPIVNKGGRTTSSKLLFTDRLTRQDVIALAAARRDIIRILEGVLAEGGSTDDPRFKGALERLTSLQEELGTVYLETTPRNLAPLVPAMEAEGQARPGRVIPGGTAEIAHYPDGRKLVVRTGDVALRLGSSRQIAVGTFPLPAVRARDAQGFVLEMDSPGERNDYELFRQFFSHPAVQPMVRRLLADLWDHVAPDVQQAITNPPDESAQHPFRLRQESANKVFYTVLDRYIESQIVAEAQASWVDEYWDTVRADPAGPAVVVNRDDRVVAVYDAQRIREMRGKDIEDLEAAIDGHPSPFDLDLSDADALSARLGYWPGTPFLSHAGMVIVEEIPDGQGGQVRKAFVYDAYPGEGIMRKELHQFFGNPEAAIGAILRLKDESSETPALAAEEVSALYELRRQRKTVRLGHGGGDAATDELLNADDAAPPEMRAQAWDSFDYAFDWRNQIRYSCSELVWTHYARNGIELADSFSMLLAPVQVAQDKLGWNVEVMIQASPQALLLSDRLRRVADFDSAVIDDLLVAYRDSAVSQPVQAAQAEGLTLFSP